MITLWCLNIGLLSVRHVVLYVKVSIAASSCGNAGDEMTVHLTETFIIIWGGLVLHTHLGTKQFLTIYWNVGHLLQSMCSYYIYCENWGISHCSVWLFEKLLRCTCFAWVEMLLPFQTFGVLRALKPAQFPVLSTAPLFFKWKNKTQETEDCSPVEMLPVEELFRVNVIPLFARDLYNVPSTFPTSQFIVWTLHPLLLLPQLVNLTIPCSVV